MSRTPLPRHPVRIRLWPWLAAVCASLILSACGGGASKTSADPDSKLTVSAAMVPGSDAEAYRFLSQATFGPTEADVARVKRIGYDNWIDEQFNTALQSSHLAMAESAAATM